MSRFCRCIHCGMVYNQETRFLDHDLDDLFCPTCAKAIQETLEKIPVACEEIQVEITDPIERAAVLEALPDRLKHMACCTRQVFLEHVSYRVIFQYDDNPKITKAMEKNHLTGGLRPWVDYER